MRQISLTKFAKIIEEEKIQSILFNSIRQGSCILSDVSIDGEFQCITIMSNPDMILLSCPREPDRHCVCFSRVRSVIDYRSDYSQSPTEFGIVCGNRSGNQPDTVYRISVSKNMYKYT